MQPKKSNFYRIALLFLLLIPARVFAQFPYNYKVLSLCYGGTWRLDQTYRHNFSIDFWNLSGACINSTYWGCGASMEWTNKSCYNIGIRYFKSPQQHPAASDVKMYFGVEPNVYFLNGNHGFNIAPEIGIHIPMLLTEIGGGISAFYAYDIPLVNTDDYDMHRQRLTVKLSLELDTICLRLRRHKADDEKQPE